MTAEMSRAHGKGFQGASWTEVGEPSVELDPSPDRPSPGSARFDSFSRRGNLVVRTCRRDSGESAQDVFGESDVVVKLLALMMNPDGSTETLLVPSA